jgi:hypothetical protein
LIAVVWWMRRRLDLYLAAIYTYSQCFTTNVLCETHIVLLLRLLRGAHSLRCLDRRESVYNYILMLEYNYGLYKCTNAGEWTIEAHEQRLG